MNRVLPARSIGYSLALAGLFALTASPRAAPAQNAGEAPGKKAGEAPGKKAGEGRYGDPRRFESAIEAFERQDAANRPEPGSVLFVGSSTIRMWHATVEQDMEPLRVVARGFGGSNMNDALHYADRIILAYRPRAVVLYEGDNDIAQGISPELVAKTFQQLVRKIHARLPETRIYFLAIKPSVKRWSMIDRMREANRQIAAACGRDERLTYVDVATPMLDRQEKVRSDLFRKDMLHMNPRGYALWVSILKPMLHKRELVHQPATPKPSGAGQHPKP